MVGCALVWIGLGGAATDLPHHHTILKGRVVAKAQPVTESLGTFFSYSETYVFEMAEPSHKLVKLSYKFWNKQPTPSESFLDYSVLHSMRTVRDISCDESLDHMAYAQGVDATGHVVQRQFTLKRAQGAPEVTISTVPLPCYALNYKDLKLDRGRKENGSAKRGSDDPIPVRQ